MATTSLWAVKGSLSDLIRYAENPEKTQSNDLANLISYAANSEKTESQLFVSGINCFAKTACEQMTNTKRRFGKLTGNAAFHGYQSFAPGEVTAELAHKVGLQYARELWGNRYEVLVATHLNTDCYHNHFVINSVSFVDGIKMVVKRGTHLDLRRVSDRICREYGLSVIERPGGKTPRGIYFAEKRGEPTRYNLMRKAIDETIKESFTMREFYRRLEAKGYSVDYNSTRKYTTIRVRGSDKPTRLRTLGENYIPEAIKNRILAREYPQRRPQPPVKHYRFNGNMRNIHKMTGLAALFMVFLYLLGVYPRKRPSRQAPLTPAMKAAVRKINEYSREVRLICREKLNTTDDLDAYVTRKSEEHHELTILRNQVYNRLRRCCDPEEIERLKARRDELTAALTIIRKDLATAKAIKAAVPAIREMIADEKTMRQSLIRAPEKDTRSIDLSRLHR